MDTSFIKKTVRQFYWHYDINCATATLKNLAAFFDITLEKQVIDSALGMHGAGGYQAQCGLVEGTIMFIGIYGKTIGLSNSEIVHICRSFAETFESRFKSLQCSVLRPEGFKPENPPHLCENLTVAANEFSCRFVADSLKRLGGKA